MDNTLKVELSFVQRRLPWIVAGAMLLVYAITLNWWVTPASAVTLAKVSGWDWRPEVFAPLHVLLTLPVRWLPAGLQIPALNFIEAACAALALALLARSVSLLPHDRTKDQRQIERSDYSLLTIGLAWLPPVLAALVCGLQLTFWENAVASNGEMLDLLVFAYLVRCLLEFRLDHDERWLKKLAFVFGLSVVNNFAMIGFFPVFVIALVWIKLATFFNWRFVGRMVLWGSMGLLLYFLLPLVASFKQPTDYSFWELLTTYWSYQKSALLSAPRYLFIFLALTSLLPVLFIGIRWPASFGDVSPTGQALTALTTHVIHLIFLAVCLYVTFDLEFSPRRILYGRYAALPFYYLGALSVGYFAGYLLLVFGVKADPNAKSWQRPSMLRQIINKALVAVVLLLSIGVPAGLAWKNFPLLRASSSPALGRHAAVLASSLPAQGAVVLGDDPIRLYALRAELRKTGAGANTILLESDSLKHPAYHRHLQKQFGTRLPNLAATQQRNTLVYAGTVNLFLQELTEKNSLFYIHPSYGYFFERLYLKPYKAVYQVGLFSTNVISAPVLTATELKAQDDYWKGIRQSDLAALAAPAKPATKPGEPPAFVRSLDDEMRVIYSRALNHFGFEAQRSGDLKLAGEYFSLAFQVNDRNLYAFINEQYNKHVQSGRGGNLTADTNALRRIEPFALSLDDRMNRYGPPDEPSLSVLLAQYFHETGLYRQAAQWLERSLYFEPANFNRRLFFITECLYLGMPDRVLSEISALRASPPHPLNTADQIDLTRAEAWAHFAKGELPVAERLLRAAQQKFPRENAPFSSLAEIYDQAGRVTNAIAVFDEQLKVQPDNFAAMVNLTALFIRSGRYSDALPFLERALKLTPDDPRALFNRGLCRVSLAQLDGRLDTALVEAALADFLLVASVDTKNHQALWGIGECYRLKKMNKQAIEYYEKFLILAPPSDPDRPLAQQRIAVLKSGGN